MSSIYNIECRENKDSSLEESSQCRIFTEKATTQRDFFTESKIGSCSPVAFTIGHKGKLNFDSLVQKAHPI